MTVKVTDAAGHELEESFTIGVGDVNEAIEDLVFSGTTVAENSPAGTVVGTASANDPDAGETLQFALSDDADGRFAIDADTGQIVVAEGASLDHEAGTSHTVTVKVTDAAGHELEESFTIGVGDVNEAIEDLVFSGGTVAENSPAGTVVGTASASDPDAGETLQFALSDDADGRFAIDADTGQIVVAEGASLDHEAGTSHTVTVKVTDAAGHELEESFTIGVGDVNEAIEDLVFSGTTVAENSPAGTVVGTASASDPDAGETLQFALSDDADGRFAIDAAIRARSSSRRGRPSTTKRTKVTPSRSRSRTRSATNAKSPLRSP